MVLLVAGKARVTDVKVKSTPATGKEVIVGLAIRVASLSADERSALFNYHGNQIEFSIEPTTFDADANKPRPLDVALAASEEHARPGPNETCRDCGKVIGDDPNAAFHTPIAGPPTPLCGECSLKAEDAEISDEQKAEERAEFLEALVAKDFPPDLHVALTDAYDSGDEARQLAALIEVGLDEDSAYISVSAMEGDELEEAIRWLREGNPEDEGKPTEPELDAMSDGPSDVDDDAIPPEFRGASEQADAFDALGSASADAPVVGGRRGSR